jgi:hypothetical protein|tara:strand:+ start:110 stop:364 length:255 start_codon:yes stop_codon:yes gene_type:complete
MINLQEAWKLVETLNDRANQQTSWEDIDQAISMQSQYFKNSVEQLDNDSQLAIKYWLQQDAEFYDYFNCLSNNMIMDFVGKDYV